MLNLGGGGDFLPYAKFNGKAGRWYVKKGEGEVEVMNPTFVADFDNIRTGWFWFKQGSAPQIVWDTSLTEPAPKPTATFTDDKGKVRDCYKRGFELKLFSEQAFGGVVVLNGAAMHLNMAVNDLYAQYISGKAANPGQLPVIQVTGTLPMKDKEGTNFKPVFSILKFVPRPSAFDAQAATPPTPAAGAASNVTPQPVAQSSSEF